MAKMWTLSTWRNQCPCSRSLLWRRLGTRSETKIEAVQRGMQRWVDEFIVAENLCPFAAKSSYEFQIYPKTHFSGDCLSFFKKQVRGTGANAEGKANRNTFVVFPFMSEFQGAARGHLGAELFWHFYVAAVEECRGLALTPMMEVADMHQDHPQREQQVIAMPFHPDFPKWNFENGGPEKGIPEERFYTTGAPFPAVHLLRLDDLTKARRGGTTAVPILERNSHTLPRIGLSSLQQKLKEYQGELSMQAEDSKDEENDEENADAGVPPTPWKVPSPKRPKVIQVVELPSPERLKRLEEQGITVQVVELAESNPPEETKQVSIGKKKKGKKKK